MNGLLQFAVSNAALAAAAALMVVGVTRVWRNPHLAHLLWALVLVKLITPPLVNVAVPVFRASPLPRELVSEPVSPAVDVEGAAGGEGGTASGADTQLATDENLREPIEAGVPMATTVSADRLTDYGWPAVLLGVWGLGSAIWVGLFAARVLEFNRLVRGMPLAPEAWQRELAALAARMDLCAWPSVRLAEGAISPLLWGVGRPTAIVMPRALAESLGPEGSRAVLAHELAHFYRRDHWMRWFEMLVLAVCWWNPVAWWARRQLRVAEEQCCDACAIWLLDGEARSYGLALLATIEFLSSAGSVAPAGASGIGDAENLKGRFEMILEARFGRRLSWRTGLAVAAIALATLPFSLSAGRAGAQAPVETDKPAAKPADAPVAKPWIGWAKLSPFTEVQVRGDAAANVEFEGKQYELVSIDGLSTEELLGGARKQYGLLWEKRFVEDLVEVMDAMGHRPAATVKLLLRDPASGAIKTVERAPMTADNRAKVYAKAGNIAANVALQAMLGGRTWARLSPFTAVRVSGDEAEVEFDGQPYQLVSIDDLPTKELLDGARKQFGDHWKKRFVEDLVEVMAAMGHRPAATVKLVLRDPRSGDVETVERAPMTAENREKVHIAHYVITAYDAKRIRALIDVFAAAVENSDLDGLAKTLRPRAPGEGPDLAYFSRATKDLPAGSQINSVRTIVPLHNHHAMAVTDFFGADVPGQSKSQCVVYHCVRQDGRWTIDSIEVVDDAGLGRALRDAPQRALAEVLD